jgi:hypothetical protein
MVAVSAARIASIERLSHREIPFLTLRRGEELIKIGRYGDCMHVQHS